MIHRARAPARPGDVAMAQARITPAAQETHGPPTGHGLRRATGDSGRAGPATGRLANTRSMTRRFSICARSAPAASRAQRSHGTGWSRVSASATAPTRSSRSSVRITSPDSHRAAPALAHGTRPVGYISYDVWRGGTGQCPPGRAGARDAPGWRPAAGPRGPPGRGRRRDRHGPPRPWATRAALARTPGDTRWPGARRWPALTYRPRQAPLPEPAVLVTQPSPRMPCGPDPPARIRPRDSRAALAGISPWRSRPRTPSRAGSAAASGTGTCSPPRTCARPAHSVSAPPSRTTDSSTPAMASKNARPIPTDRLEAVRRRIRHQRLADGGPAVAAALAAVPGTASPKVFSPGLSGSLLPYVLRSAWNLQSGFLPTRYRPAPWRPGTTSLTRGGGSPAPTWLSAQAARWPTVRAVQAGMRGGTT